MPDPLADVALAAAKPLAAQLVQSLLKPLLAVAQSIADPIIDVFGDRFSDYLARQLVKHSYLPTIVFQVRRPLEEIYIPLTVIEEASLSDKPQQKSYKIDKYHQSFIPTLNRVLIIDGAGMGKSTLSRYMFVQAIKTLATVPIFIELRHLNADRTILDYLLSELNPVGTEPSEQKIDKRQIVRLLTKGVFTFFLDGYDEVANADREKVTRDIKIIAETYPENKLLITSRPEHALASFPSFHAYRIRSLEREEAFALIRKYDKDGDRGTKLIERLADKSLKEVDEFLKNPLLTTLLYRAFDYKNQIPLKKPNFYRQVFDALFEWHDLTKDGYSTREKSCKLDIDGFHKVFRGLGFVSTLKGRVEADTDEMLGWIREARTYAPELQFSESDFLDDAIKAVPILRREGNTILWSHKSLAEYFCAQFIVTDSKLDQPRICNFLVKNINLPSFRNLLDLLYDMDVALFSQYFIKSLINFYDLELERLKYLHPEIPTKSIEQRAATTFGRRLFIIRANGVASKTLPAKIAAISCAAMKDWYGIDVQADDSNILDGRLNLEIADVSIQKDDQRLICFSHALRTVMSVLTSKKHPLIQLRAFYPAEAGKARVIGSRGAAGLSLNEAQKSVWNNLKNFDQTTLALMRGAPSILNRSKISSTLHDINVATGNSQTTASLLTSLEQ